MTRELNAVTEWLDGAFDLFNTGAWADGLQRTADHIHQTYLEFGDARFRQEVLPLCLEHPLRGLIHQDPYTRHSFLRPRGYAGDAALIDFFYGLRGPEDEDTELGKFIFTTHMESSAARSVRYRRTLLGERLETLALKGPGEVLSVACGHLCEVLFAPTLRLNPELRITALDQDAGSLLEVERMCQREGLTGITTLHADLKPILFGRLEGQRWDFIYAAGLYDYLPDKLARRLTGKLFKLLAPGERCCWPTSSPTCTSGATWSPT